MKNLQNIHLITGACTGLLFLVVLALIAGCEKWIDPEINVNPNQPEDVTMETLLPFIQADVAFQIAGGIELVSAQAVLMQQLDGVDRQLIPISNYVVDPYNLVLIWGDAYAEILMDAKQLREKAVQLGSPYNEGVADILAAFTLGQVTDAWGDVPWSEALQGSEIMQPRYDAQEDIYRAIFDMLDRAIVSLSADADPFGIRGDYYYNGNRQNWIRAAYALKARYAIHLSNRRGEQAWLDALNALPLAFTGLADDMRFVFGTGESESNPLYQFMRDRKDIRMGAYFIDMLKADDDPRLPVYALPDKNGDYTGSVPGLANVNASMPGAAVAAPAAPTYVISYAELLFIKAEAMLKTGHSENEVKAVLREAVGASLAMHGVTDEDWLTAYGDKVAGIQGEHLYREIMTQKYIATFCQPETFHSWRRTGYPVIPPNPNGATSEIPRRFPYPLTEMVYNPNTPKGLTLTDRVWWD